MPDSQLVQTVLTLGGLPPMHLLPPGAVVGVVNLAVTMVKNVANAIDLHTGGTPPYSTDLRLKQAFGAGAQPQMVGVVASARISVLANNESDTVLQNIRRYTYLKVIKQTDTYYFPMIDGIDFWPDFVAMAGGDSTAGVAPKQYSRTPQRGYLPLYQAMEYNANIDQVQVCNDTSFAATNDIQMILQMSGAWYPLSWGEPTRPTIGAVDQATKWRTGRAATYQAGFSAFTPNVGAGGLAGVSGFRGER